MNFESMRSDMIEVIKSEGIRDPKVLEAISVVPREMFVPDDLKKASYVNSPLPVGHGQTISQPYTVAFMLELLDVKKGDKVLEIGTGSGYNAAILSLLVGETGRVFTLEVVKELAKKAKRVLKDYKNIKVIVSDGSIGYAKEAPYDKIIVTAASPWISEEWIDQLRDNGIIVAPVGKSVQEMTKIIKKGESVERETHGYFQFVPLVGKRGF
jgi:protein-L-isoaspartate(D-aspartate) O-methyltransferase